MNSWLKCVVAAGIAAGVVLAQDAPGQLTLEQAVDLARERSRSLKARRAEIEAAAGRSVTAQTYPHNPEVTVEGAHRSSDSGDDSTDSEIALSQEIEIGGQRGRRGALAQAELDAANARLSREEQLLTARVREAFVEALRSRDLVEVERANMDLAGSLAEVARKRFEAGAVAQVEVNLAQVQSGRAERELRQAEGAYAVSRSLFALVVGLDPLLPPTPVGELDSPTPTFPSDAELATAAVSQRADLQALRHERDAARERIELARKERVPDLTLEAFAAREDGTDRLAGGSIGISIPLFDRNQGAIAESLALERRAQAEADFAELAVRQEIAATLARYRTAEAAARTLRQQVLGTLDENLDLLQRSFEAGKTSWTEVLVFRREFVEVQREYIETVTEKWHAAIELELATGAPLPFPAQEARP